MAMQVPSKRKATQLSRTPLLRHCATILTATILIGSAVLLPSAQAQSSPPRSFEARRVEPVDSPRIRQGSPQSSSSGYEGKTIQALDLPGVAQPDRDHLVQLLSLKVGMPLGRDKVRES